MTNTQAFIGQEPDSDLDYMLAVSLQRENGSREHSAAQIQRELWEDFCPIRTKLVVEGDSSTAQNCDSPFISQGFPTNTPNKPKGEGMVVAACPGAMGRVAVTCGLVERLQAFLMLGRSYSWKN